MVFAVVIDIVVFPLLLSLLFLRAVLLVVNAFAVDQVGRLCYC